MAITPEQRAMRRSGIGGSDAAAILGIDPFRDSFDVWLSKVRDTEDRTDPRKEWGTRLEPVIAQAVAEELQMVLSTPGDTIRHPAIAHMLANVDGVLIADDTNRVLETKTIDRSFADRLGVPWTDQALPEHVVQVSHYMAVLDLPSAVIGYLVGGNDLRIYEVRRSAELERVILAAEAAFWTDHVLTQSPPDGGKPDVIAKWLAKKLEAQDGKTLVVNDGSPMEVVTELRESQAVLRAAKERSEVAKNAVRMMMGSATILTGEWGRITWKTSKKGTRTLRHPWSSDDE